MKKKILAALKTPVTLVEIMEITEFTEEQIKKVLIALSEEGKLLREGNEPSVMYSLFTEK